jgi:hypothetical protein
MRVLRYLLVVVFLATSALAAHADSYEYNFTGFTVTESGIVDASNFTYISSALITTDTLIDPLSCHYFAQSCTDVEIDPTGDLIQFRLTGGPIGTATWLGFPAGFFSVGTHNLPLFADLTITDLTPIAATPEPSTIALLGTGLLGIVGTFRRRFIQV